MTWKGISIYYCFLSTGGGGRQTNILSGQMDASNSLLRMGNINFQYSARRGPSSQEDKAPSKDQGTDAAVVGHRRRHPPAHHWSVLGPHRTFIVVIY